MPRNYLIIVHPQTGKRHRLGKIISELNQYFDTHKHHHDLYYTRPDLNATELVKHQLRDHSDIIAIGGDGTLNEVINGFDNPDLVFSFIPNGSGNDFAKNFHFQSLEHQVTTALEGPVRTIDLGLCNQRKFINGVGIGLDGQVIYDLLYKKNILSGSRKYYYHVLRNLLAYKSQQFKFRVDDVERQQRLLLLCVANGTTFGNGFRLTPQADFFDGQLDVCQIAPLNVWKRLIHIPKLAKGTHYKLHEVEMYQARQVYVAENDLLHAHIDGEYMGTPPFDITLLPAALKIRLPKEYFVRKNN